MRHDKPFYIDACVVLPDHLHCIWTLPPGDADYASRWKNIKAAFSRQIPATETLSDVRVRLHERGIWQRRYWEHTIRDDQDYMVHMDYCHINPFKHGLVAAVRDWPFSTFHRYVQVGVYPIDWAGVASDLPAGERCNVF